MTINFFILAVLYVIVAFAFYYSAKDSLILENSGIIFETDEDINDLIATLSILWPCVIGAACLIIPTMLVFLFVKHIKKETKND